MQPVHVYKDWYVERMYLCVMDPDTRERRVINDIRRLVEFLNRFLPSNTTIAHRPDDLYQRTKYSNFIERLAVKVERDAMAWLQSPAIRLIWNAKPEDVTKTKRQARVIKPWFTTVLKKIAKIGIEQMPNSEGSTDMTVSTTTVVDAGAPRKRRKIGET